VTRHVVCYGWHPKRPIEALSTTPGDGADARGRDGDRKKPPTKKITATKAEGEDGARVSKVRVLLGALVVLVLTGFAAGCGSASDQGQSRQEEAKKKIEAKGQQARQEAEKKVNEKKQEVKQEVQALQKQVEDLKKEVADLQTKINAHEEKEQQQQINQLKKALNDLKKRVEAQERQSK
jgi:predicted RNase H-like nuclease (RuvC/YqgF family)